MLYRTTVAVGSEIHTKYINAVCGQNVEFIFKPSVIKNNQEAFRN
jgi:hypothetical protein